MKEQKRTNKAATTAQNNQVEPQSQAVDQTVDEQLAEAVEQSYARKLTGAPTDLSEEERQRIQGTRANSKR
jgi:hypothetical protein